MSNTSGDKATPTSPDHASGEEEEEEEGEEGEEEGSISDGSEGESEDGDQSDEGTEHTSHSHNITTPAKRGTEIRLSGLVMGEGVGVMKCASVKVMLQCTRCRGYQDENMKAER